MPNTVNIPGVNYKMDKIKFIIILAVVVLVVIIIANPGAFFSSIIKKIIDGIGSAVKGVGTGIVNGVNDVTGVTASDAANDAQSKRIDKYWTGTTWVSWMTPDLYNSDPTSASIDNATAMNLYNNIRSAEGSSVLGLSISSGDFSGIQTDFSNVIGNQTDISYVSFICQQQSGRNFGQICEDTNNFYNASVGAGGDTNLKMLADFLDWAGSLPVN